MKKNLLGLCLLLLSCVFVKAQTADEIIAKHIEARGGMEKLKALQSLVLEGTMQQQGVDVSMKFFYMQNTASRVEFTAMNQTGYNIITTTNGWSMNPFTGNDALVALPEEAVKEAQVQLDIQGPLVDYKDKGSKVEYLGRESVQGADMFKLKLTRANGKSILYYLNKDYLVAKSVSTATVNGNEQEVITEYSDFKKTPEGYTLAFHRINANADITFDKIIINSKLDDTLFKPSN